VILLFTIKISIGRPFIKTYMYSYKSSKSSLIKLLRRILASFIAGVFLVNTLFFDIAIAQPSVSTLAPLAASENPKVKREITAAMFRASRLIWLANSPRYLDLLSRYSALALLLPSGRYLMTPETAANDLTLIRSAAHEDNEVLMQQEEKLHATRYNKLMRQILDRDDIMKLYYVLSHYKEPTKQPNNIVFNDLISKAFEILFILDEGLVYPDELKPEEREFIVLMRPILQAKDSLGRYKNFSQVFFDTDKRTKAIKALQENKDERFYRVANSVLADNSPPEDLQKRLLSATEILLPMLKVVDIEKVRGPPDVLSKMKSILIQSGQEVDVQRFSHLLKVKPIPDEIIFFIDNKCLLVRKNELQDAMKNLDMADLQQIILSLGAYINLWENNTILDEADNILLSAKSSIQSGQVVNQFAVAFQRPLLIGNVKIPSRFCIQAMNGNDSVDGLPSERTLRRYEEYGRSGAGLIISESSGIGETWRTNNLIVNRDHAQGVNNIVAAVKRENPTAVLLFQIGYKCPTPASVAIFDPHFARLEGKEPLHETLTREEIRSIINSYIDAAEVVYDSGGDGVELKACHMSLLMNFLMPSNHRQDEYGGTLNNRMRIVLEIINGIRKRIPDTRFKIGVRLSMYEGLSYPGGMGTVNHLSASEDISESCAMLAAFADAGAELLNISAGNAVLTPDVMSPTEMPSNFSLANLEGFPLFRYAKTAKDYLRARGINDVVLIGSGFSTFGKALPYVAMLNLSNENMDLIGIGRQAFVDPDLLHIASCEFKTCALCNRCFHVLLMKYQLPANCIRNGDYRKLFSMLQGGKIEEIGPDLIEFVVRAYLSLKGDSKREMAEFMARYGDAFNEIFLKRLQNNPADADALFYFDQTRDLEVFYKVQQLRNTIEVGLRPLYDNVLRNIQAGIAISPSQPENTTAVGWTEKHRLDDTYREFVLPLASQISREHNVRLTQYAAADGTTSVDLDNLLQEAKIDTAIF